MNIWDKVFKNGQSQISGRQPLKDFTLSIRECFVIFDPFREGFLFLLKRFLSLKYSQTITSSFYIEYTRKNVGIPFLGAHTVQTIQKHVWKQDCKSLYQRDYTFKQ